MENSRENYIWKLVAAIISLVMLLSMIGVRTYKSVMFNRDCGDHMKRAADANTVEMATQEMSTVVHYLEVHQMTHGYTSVLFDAPDNDVGYWYNNLKASLEELEKVTPQTTQLEKSNLLLKLRETLLDGNDVTVPEGVSAFPNNFAYFWGLMAIIAFFLVGCVLFVQYGKWKWGWEF